MGNNYSDLENLYQEFPDVPTSEWEKKIQEDLKGADYNEKLVWRTLDGFDMRPYYRMEDLENLAYLESLPGQFPFHRSAKTLGNNWLIRQDIKISTHENANREALEAIQKGATSVGFDLRGSEVPAEKDLFALLKDIHLNEIAVNLLADDHYSKLLLGLKNVISETGADPHLVNGSISFDPFGTLAARGNFRKDLKGELNELLDCIEFTRTHLPCFRVLNVGGDLFHDAGGSITQELAYALSLGNEYLAQLTGMGLDLKDLLPSMQFQLSAASSYFMVIAKHRAARYLWSKITEAYDPVSARRAAMFIHTKSSSWIQAIYDPYVNLLRTTTSSMAAIIGGTDSLQVNPFDSAYRKPVKQSERIARNTQVILKEESHLDKVIDPSAGSYYIENLTDSLITKAWEIFLDVEDKGGFHESLTQGFIQESINSMVKHRRERFANRKDLLLGTNQYPNFGEEMSGEIDPSLSLEQILPEDQRIIKPLIRSRSGIEFEKLRLKTEAHPGKKPVAFMFSLGNLAMRRARAMFACNFFAIAGFKVIDNIGFTSPEEGIKEALRAEADIVVLCSSDDEYPEFAEEVAKHLKQKCVLVIAGYPKDHREEIEKTGFEHFIHIRSNVLEEIRKFQKLLGIESPAKSSNET